MTLVLGAANPWYGLMVSDRLVTLSRGGAFAGRHDGVANKTVVFLTRDAIVVFGYTGSAYLEGLPTDQWLAQTLWGEPILPDPRSGELPFMRRGPRPGPDGFNANLLALRRGLAAVTGGDQVTILAAGWRIRRRRLAPVLIEFGAWKGTGAEGSWRCGRSGGPASCWALSAQSRRWQIARQRSRNSARRQPTRPAIRCGWPRRSPRSYAARRRGRLRSAATSWLSRSNSPRGVSPAVSSPPHSTTR